MLAPLFRVHLRRRGLTVRPIPVPVFRRWLGSASPTSPAFAFDIDGVLLKGKRVIPQAKQALMRLTESSPPIPYILLTNGGGITEQRKAEQLSGLLDIEILPSQVIQGHSPMQSLVSQYGNKGVLVVGGDGRETQNVAKTYGFHRTLIPEDLHRWEPSIWPFKRTPTAAEDERVSYNLSDFDPARDAVASIMVFHDSRDWGTDIQVCLDVLTAKGGRVVGDRWESGLTQQVPIYFAAHDLVWSNEFPSPRLGQGGFKVALETLYSSLTGSELKCTVYGKPNRVTYEFAEKVLHAEARRLGLPDQPLHVHAVGDNPNSDIAGAKAFGWESYLVRTGIFKGPPGENDPNHPADHVVEHVDEAVLQVLSRPKP
ncbi:HAD-like domain-containing protein [Piptocephalis cylindrospora]|uniref:HAD-like domain-containing protein n=1 Tax=Piptocephalis cylindrospora TaxID=1907219 RepID=A0A4P9Y709_9FUNG|nr:HAD-like domain-containing protein [Piptocephalis cylindrospora]|eukprot:RKP13640.1 HAD-like domain-containing protein [Piptocephalis cylindrospora]